MNREERERMVDRLLNQTLAPQDAEPRAGLEERILANLRSQPERRRRWKWVWVPAAVAATVLLAVAVKPTKPIQPTKAPVAAEHQPAPRTAERVPNPPAVAVRRKPVRTRSAPRVIAEEKTEPVSPRQPVFAPARLTEAERALMVMLQSKPSEAQSLMQQQEQSRQETAEYMEQAFKPQQ